MKTVLALAAHPDDLEIGCGGTLAKHVARGDEVHIYIATCGEVGGDAGVRKNEQLASAAILGIKAVHWGDFADTQLPASSLPLMADLEAVMQKVKPDTVYFNHPNDTHQDHRELALIARSVTRYIPNVLCYETPSTFGFEPTVYMETSDTLNVKLKALEAHHSQIERTHLHLNIMDIALATSHFRGVQGKLSCAEAFVPIRIRL